MTALNLRKGTQKALILPDPFLKGETDSLSKAVQSTRNKGGSRLQLSWTFFQHWFWEYIFRPAHDIKKGPMPFRQSVFLISQTGDLRAHPPAIRTRDSLVVFSRLWTILQETSMSEPGFRFMEVMTLYRPAGIIVIFVVDSSFRTCPWPSNQITSGLGNHPAVWQVRPMPCFAWLLRKMEGTPPSAKKKHMYSPFQPVLTTGNCLLYLEFSTSFYIYLYGST